jgi:hypothetical protein
MKWTIKDEGRLRDMHDKGCSIEEIASALGREAGAVRARARQLSLKKHESPAKPWTREEDEELLRLCGQGFNIEEISSMMGRPEGSIRSRMKKRKLRAAQEGPGNAACKGYSLRTLAQMAKADMMLQGGASLNQLAEAMAVQPCIVGKYLKLLGQEGAPISKRNGIVCYSSAWCFKDSLLKTLGYED